MRTKTLVQADKMLDAAARLFGSQRFHEVRMEDIATEAEVGKGTLYRYFSDKEELYLALLERASRDLVHCLKEELRCVSGARAQLEAVVAAIVAYFDEQPHLFDLIQRAEVLRSANRDFPWQRARDEVLHLVRDLFEAGARSGEFAVNDPDMAVLLLLGGLRGVTRFGSRPRPADLAQRIVDSFLHGAATTQGVACGTLEHPRP